MVYRIQSTDDETVDVLDVTYIARSIIGYLLQPDKYENSDINLMLKYSLPYKVKLNITTDDFSLSSNFTKNKTYSFLEKRSFIPYYDLLKPNQE